MIEYIAFFTIPSFFHSLENHFLDNGKAAGFTQLKWNSISNLLNILEQCTNFNFDCIKLGNFQYLKGEKTIECIDRTGSLNQKAEGKKTHTHTVNWIRISFRKLFAAFLFSTFFFEQFDDDRSALCSIWWKIYNFHTKEQLKVNGYRWFSKSQTHSTALI